jgi:hypothetical protein
MAPYVHPLAAAIAALRALINEPLRVPQVRR